MKTWSAKITSLVEYSVINLISLQFIKNTAIPTIPTTVTGTECYLHPNLLP